MNNLKVKVDIIQNKESKEYEAAQGTSIAKALKSMGFFVDSVCGGIGKCGKCKIKVSAPINIEITAEERRHLDEKEIKDGIRLACSIPVVDGMKIWIDQPIVNQEKSAFPLCIAASENIGAAVDIGTTTIVLSLVDISTGKVISTESTTNPQVVYGADVISRIAYAGNNPSRLKEMQKMIISAINRLVDSALKNTAQNKKSIYKVVVSGNTVMLHLFQGLDVQSLGIFPYETKNTAALKKNGNETGLKVIPNGEVCILPCISAFLGADIVSGVLKTKMYQSEKMCILLDLGTNGEIVAGNRFKMVGCSTAAGPAFEGAGIKCGSTNVEGAIDKIFSNGKNISYTTIGNMPPKSICGSGIIDITAILFEKGVIQENGRMLNYNQDNQSFLIAEGENKIVFTQEDVRQVQLAKSAAATGIMMIMKRLNIDFNDVDKLYIAGNFGSFLNIQNAVKIGLIPESLKDKIVIVGNSSVDGAVECLLDFGLIEECSKIQMHVEYYDIGMDKDFQESYVNNLNF